MLKKRYPTKTRKSTKAGKRKWTRRGGAKNTVPLPETFAELDSTWNFFFVGAHGALTGDMFVVPENTYILNLATAGRPCNKVSWEIENWIYDYDPRSRFAPAKSILQKLYESIKGKTFLRDTGGVSKKSYIYTPGTTNLNVLEMYKNESTKEETSLSFYEPGDLLFNTRLSMYNDTWPIMLVGAYTVPVPYELKRNIYEKNAFLFPEDTNADTLSSEDIQAISGKPIPQGNPTPLIHKIFDVESNMLKNEMFPTGAEPVHLFNLRDVITNINIKTSDGKKRLFIVRACRIGPDKPTAALMRRFSIAARERPKSKITDPEKPLRSRLNKDFFARIKGALTNKLKQPSVKPLDKLTIIGINEEIDHILNDDPFTMDTVKSILEQANRFVTFQSEFKQIFDLP